MRARIVTALLVLTAVAAVDAASAPSLHDPCIHGNRVRFRAADGTRLVGARFGRGTTAVVLAHQSRGDLCQWESYARRLAARGYLAFPFDFRGYGESQYRPYPASRRLAGDVAAAAKALRRLGAKRVFLVGASMGGTAVVVAGANTRPPVNGVVSVSGDVTYGNIDAVAAAKKLNVPVLYIAGAGDTSFARYAHNLFDATPTSDKKIEILPSPAHGVALVAASSRARALIESFIRSP